ncbi:MAG: 50S ribosomal protein L3 [Candidatus Micrarchaeaceae archaeon]
MRKGSLEFRPHRVAQRQMPRIRHWPQSAEAIPLGLVAIKAGMTHIALVDNSNAPSKGSEIVRGVTVLEVPRMYVYGVRLYKRSQYKEPAEEYYFKGFAKRFGIKNTKKAVESIDSIKADDAEDVTALIFADLAALGHGNKKSMRFEVAIGGKSTGEKLAYITKVFGKEIKAAEIIKEGEYVDITGITKGKGWQGPIKRFGVAKQVHKATKKIRHVGTLGPWHPPKVLYSVPQAGHLGYNYRTELNKRVYKVGNADSANQVNVAGGFLNYGIIRNDFIIVDGSVPGPAKRLVRIRKAIRNRAEPEPAEITYISTTSKQGA